MTFFTEDTCYNLALVTVLALVALYLIGKFFTEEEFTVYFEKSAPIDYAECTGHEANKKGVNSKGNKFCNDSHTVVAKPVIKKSHLYSYNTDEDLSGYNNCVLEGGESFTHYAPPPSKHKHENCNVNIAGGSYDLN